MLFRWFIDLSIDPTVWDVTVFTKNRDRLLEGDIARSFLLAVPADPQIKPLLSGEHFSVDGTMIDAWAEQARAHGLRSRLGWRAEGSIKSFQPKDGSGPPADPGRNGERDLRGQKRSNETHHSVTDPEARLYRKSDRQPARLCYLGHILMENRSGLIVDAELTQATSWAERAAAAAMIETTAPSGRVTLGADRGGVNQGPVTAKLRRVVNGGYDTAHVATCAASALRRMWRKTRTTAAPPSTAAPPGTPAMRSANVFASGSKSRSAG